MLNDRILYEWRQFAGRWDHKTISAKLTAIRQFEAFCDGITFAEVSKSDVVDCSPSRPLRQIGTFA